MRPAAIGPAIWHAIWGLIVSLAVLGMLYPDAVWAVFTGSVGAFGWFLGIVGASWWGCLKFVGAVVAVTAVLAIWSGQRARAFAAGTGPEAQEWEPAVRAWPVTSKLMWSVTGAVLIELLLPAVLFVGLIAVLQAVISLVDIARPFEKAVAQIAGGLTQNWTASPAEIYRKLEAVLSAVNGGPGSDEAAKFNEVLNKSLAVLTGVASAVFSLFLYLIRRRNRHLNAASLILEEVKLSVRDALTSMPPVLAGREKICAFPKDTYLIGTSAESRMLLLNPSTGLATRLPSCLLAPAVAFVQADTALTQTYNGLLTTAFAQASDDRRREYIDLLKRVYLHSYQPAAYKALFSIAFYLRLRAWSI